MKCSGVGREECAHTDPSARFPPFKATGVREHPAPGGAQAVSLATRVVWGLGAATHLLVPEDPEVMELFDQGVGAAGCGREKSVTNRNVTGPAPILKCWAVRTRLPL